MDISNSSLNWVVRNKGNNPLVNFNFLLRVELIYDLPCKSVKAFTRELEYELIQEGGLNDYVHMRRKPISKPFTLEIERYAGVDFVDPLPLGADLALPVFLFVSRYPDKFLGTARSYIFTGCTVIKRGYGELQADRSGLLTDVITLSYREMICINTVFSDIVGGGFDNDNDKLWSTWQKEIDEKAKSRTDSEKKRKDDYENKKKDLDKNKTAEEELKKAADRKLKEIDKARADKQKELDQLNSAIAAAVLVNEAERKTLLDSRKQKVEDIKKINDELMKAKTSSNAAEQEKIEKMRNDKLEELKDIRQKEVLLVAKYEEEMAALLKARAEKEDEIKKLNEEEAAAVEEYEKQRKAILDEREALLKEMQAAAGDDSGDFGDLLNEETEDYGNDSDSSGDGNG